MKMNEFINDRGNIFKMHEFTVGEFVEYKPTKQVAKVCLRQEESFDKTPTGFYEWIPIVFKNGEKTAACPRELVLCTESWYNASPFIRGIKRLFHYKPYK